MTQGRDAGELGATAGPYDAPPDDTGEAIGLPPSGLTIIFGFGPTLFRKDGKDRFGLADRQSAALGRLPHFPPRRQPRPGQVRRRSVHPSLRRRPAGRRAGNPQLGPIAFGRAAVRWSQLGFGRTSSTSTAQATPRNLFGFKDGTANLKAEETALIDKHVWVPVAWTREQSGWPAAATWWRDGSP